MHTVVVCFENTKICIITTENASCVPFAFFHGFLLADGLWFAAEVHTDAHQDTTAVHKVAWDVDNDEEHEEDNNNDPNNSSSIQGSSRCSRDDLSCSREKTVFKCVKQVWDWLKRRNNKTLLYRWALAWQLNYIYMYIYIYIFIFI